MDFLGIRSDSENLARARQLCEQLDTVLLEKDPAGKSGYALELKGNEMILHSPLETRFRPWILELGGQYPPRGRDPLVRAMGTPGSRVVDATAGWCRDALHIAGAGHRVIAIERNPLLAVIVEHALGRLCRDDARPPFDLQCGNSIDLLSGISPAPDVVYLDPMYPPNRKSAATRKELAILRDLVDPLEDRETADRALFNAAMDHARRRVVVKRPPGAAPLEPGKVGEIRAKLVRFDIYHPGSRTE